MEQSTHRYAVIALPDGTDYDISPEFIFRLAWMSCRIGKDGILVVSHPGKQLPEVLYGFTQIDAADPEWKEILVDELRGLGYSII